MHRLMQRSEALTNRDVNSPDAVHRSLMIGGGVAIATLRSTRAIAQATKQVHPPVAEPVSGPYPEPPAAKSAGPIKPGRGSALTGKVVVVTGPARGIGRAIAVEYAANGADIIAIDIAGPVSPTADAIPATPTELSETVDQIERFGRRGTAIRADIRDMDAPHCGSGCSRPWQNRYRRGECRHSRVEAAT
jgi:hypothetical protein